MPSKVPNQNTSVSGNNRPLHPDGTFQAVVVDVVNLGVLPTPWGDKRKVRLYYETAEEVPGEQRPFVVSNTCTASLDERATLRRFVEGVLGRKLAGHELRGFDLETLVGCSCLLTIVHESARGGDVYAKVQQAQPLMRGMLPLGNSGQYTRFRDRPVEDQVKFFERVHEPRQGGGNGTTKPTTKRQEQEQEEDDEIPF